MASYFDFFPKFNYDMNKDKTTIEITNIMRRYKPVEKVLKDAILYHTYTVLDGERPDVVSHKFYGTVDHAETILMFNRMLDRYFEWPLSYDEFNRYLEKKYGSVANSTQIIHHYEYIVQHKEILSDGTEVPEKVIIVDEEFFNTIVASDRRIVYCYDYEDQLNDSRRFIKLVDYGYIRQIEDERSRIFDNG